MEEVALRQTNSAFGCFYTSDYVGDALVRSMTTCPERIVDLGAGKGSLALAAARRWQSTEIVTVDIDSRAGTCAARASLLGFHQKHKHVEADVLDVRLPKRLLRDEKKFDAAVCNPPYITPKWKATFAHILEDAGLSCVLQNNTTIGADVLFLAQSLRLTDASSELGLIIPDGIVTGRRQDKLRQSLLAQHCIRSVVQLPRGCFKGTDAQAFILILGKGESQAKTIKLKRLTADGKTLDPIFISAGNAEDRCDYSYYAAQAQVSKRRTWSLSDADARIVRGSLQAGEAKQCGYKYIHTTSFAEAVSNQFRLPRKAPRLSQKDVVIAKAGDILVARVDRNLHQKVAIVSSGQAVLTDCVFRIRVPVAWRERAFRALSSRRGAEALNAVARGVGAKLLTKENLLHVRLS
ncbi:N-6 DNA methylase [Bradyrhizobium sp. 930_D9_N1_4]|uniref:N-6 DNA methylase n=1 Tax=Bradyrhizobium sp. 930_D9_N1_4 TaxID=3240374 RepID=UPI003F8BCF4B